MHLSSLFSSTSSTRTAVLTTVLLGLASSAQAVDRTTEAGEAQITDPTAECTYYNYAPVTAANSSFPQLWMPASIVASDTEAQTKWAGIQASIPTTIQPKGTINGDFSNFTPTYSTSDPDCWWSYDQCVTPKLSGLPADIFNVAEPKTLGYGFDDGPNCSHNAFYDYLTSQNQKATMFYIGSNVMNWPLEAQRAITDGHEICAHTWSHRYMTAFSSADAFAELYYSIKAIKLVTGVTPTCWRPPYGDVDDRIRAIAHALGLRTILWRYDTFDWEEGTGGVTAAQVDANYQAILTAAGNGTFNTAGAIILTHEIDNFTMSEAIKFYPQLKAAFSHIVPVGVSLNITQPYVETNYSLPTFAQYTAGDTTVAGGSGSSSASASGSSGSSKPSSAAQSGSGSSGAVPSLNTRDSMVLAVVAVMLSAAFSMAS